MQHRALKKFSQNFLTQPAIAQKIVDALHISEEDQIIEIGPGKGILTRLIIEKKPALFHAIEIDKNLAGSLRELYKDQLNIVEQDFLLINLSDLIDSKLKTKIIGNIPYNITSPILFKLIDHFEEIDCTVLMMQKEVTRRISAKVGSKDYGILSILQQTFSDVEYLFEVKNKNFNPLPKVDSAIVKLTYFQAVEGIKNLQLYRTIVRGVFNYRRKMLRNSLSRIFDQSIVTSLIEFDLTRRPEQLTIQEFKHLANTIDRLI